MNTPELYSERLHLRRFCEQDVDAVLQIYKDGEVNTFLPMFPLITQAEAAAYLQEHYLQSYERATGYRYAICLREDDIPIGYVHVADDDSYDVGYALRKEYWHQGIIRESMHLVIQQLQKDGIPYITATHDINNPRSGEVMKAIGMSYQYSYEEQWQPKNISVIFRMYQLNLQEENAPVYRKYWEMYKHHFIEEL